MVRDRITSLIGRHEETHILEDHDKRAIRQEIEESTPCSVQEAKILNPVNDREGFYLKVFAEQKSNLFNSVTRDHIHDAAVHIGYDGSSFDSGVPSPDKNGFTQSFFFKNRIQ